jgi:4'-phosphopantetheinyl transferase
MPCCWSSSGPIPLAEQEDAGPCQVWIAGLGQLRPEHEALLDATEQARAGTYARAADRSRFVLGAALLKLAVADSAGRAATEIVVDRECEQCGRQHGRPQVPGLKIHVSVAHSGDLVTIALTSLAPVGIDVEQRTGPPDPALVTRVLAPTERLDAEPWFLAYWCRKESVLKATGAGLRVPMTEVVVTAPDRSPGLISYQGDVLPATMFDLDVGDPGYAAALTVLTAQPVQLRVDPADQLLCL